ncbi:hypothetical protein AAG570_010110 [Ranatra chinensis]|uniref:Uncharacterized protein n=1 Tax=Ranatra chinensis TaxID=642074 RepID=A0ABD0YLK7_9HEMI
MKVPDLNLAVSAFEEGLQCSPNHWPSIDNIITVSYALGNYLTCLYFISKGLQMDPGYIKGHAFKAKVFQHSSSLLTEFPLYYPDWPDEISLDTDLVRSFYIEAEDLAEREKKRWKPSLPKPLVPLRPEQPIKLDSWIQLAKCLLYMINLTEEQHPGEPIFRPVLFSCESGRESPVEVQDCDSDEEMSDECLGKSQDSDGDDQGGKGRSTVLERWMFSQKRRSARVRSTVRREEPSLARSLAQLIPPNLLPREDKRAEGAHWTDDSMQTMDLYRLFENKDSNEEVKTGQNMITNEERNR